MMDYPRRNDYIVITESKGSSKYLTIGSMLKVLKIREKDEKKIILKCVIKGKKIIVRNWLYSFYILRERE